MSDLRERAVEEAKRVAPCFIDTPRRDCWRHMDGATIIHHRDCPSKLWPTIVEALVRFAEEERRAFVDTLRGAPKAIDAAYLAGWRARSEKVPHLTLRNGEVVEQRGRCADLCANLGGACLPEPADDGGRE